jgi:hypothetical protein
MAANKKERFGPFALTATLTTNLIAPAAAGASAVGYTATASQIILTHVRITNKTAGAVTFSMWIGATGANLAGTEFLGTGISVAANSSFDWYGSVLIKAGEFLVGGASALTSLTFQAEGEVGLA